MTGDVFEQATRYRDSFDPARGEPIAWLLGIARRCIATNIAQRPAPTGEPPDVAAPGDLEQQSVDRVWLSAAIRALSDRDQELIALRYGADLRARQIGQFFDMSTGAAEVALHRALERLRRELTQGTERPETSSLDPLERPV